MMDDFNRAVDELRRAIAEVDEAIQRARDAAQISDPSRLFAERIGPPIAEGMAAAVIEGREQVQRSLEELLDR